MPIEIKELHIKAIVAPSGNNEQAGKLRQEEIARLKREIIQELLSKLSHQLDKKNER